MIKSTINAIIHSTKEGDNMVTKEEVRNLLSKYVTKFIYDEEIKSIEALTKKVDFDMELVIDDIESIRRFFFEKLGAKKYVITLEDLCKTSTGEIWNDLQDLQDLKTLEELLALGILVDVIKDDKKMRAEAFFNIGGNCIYLTPELLRLETIEEEHQYMEVMREHVLPHYKFEINRGRRIVEPKPHYTKQEVKDLLILFLHYHLLVLQT